MPPRGTPLRFTRASSFVIEASTGTGLNMPTEFDLVDHHRLPFDHTWFSPAPGKTPSCPRRGRLDLHDAVVKRKLQSAIVEARSQPKDF
jgi:hypothetical protein